MIFKAQIPFGTFELAIESVSNNKLVYTIYRPDWVFINEEESKKEEGKRELRSFVIGSSEVNIKQAAEELSLLSNLLNILSKSCSS